MQRRAADCRQQGFTSSKRHNSAACTRVKVLRYLSTHRIANGTSDALRSLATKRTTPSFAPTTVLDEAKREQSFKG